MKRNKVFITVIFFISLCLLFSFNKQQVNSAYNDEYKKQIKSFSVSLQELGLEIKRSNLQDPKSKEALVSKIKNTRIGLKQIDFWLRYLEPLSYKKINGPLPVEWETEVFEKFEKPYRREGAGLTLAELYLSEESPIKDSLLHLIENAELVSKIYLNDSITKQLNEHHHFYLCNRLFLLNLATIYTTGFECPNTNEVINELMIMLEAVKSVYLAYNTSFTDYSVPNEYILLYNQTIDFVKQQPKDFENFDHFEFIKSYVNPLFSINQNLIREFKVSSKSNLDYSLNKNAASIFSKNLYFAQNTKGLFKRINDQKILNEIEQIGKLLFYDPILSANNLRSCASCHQPKNFFTDTVAQTSLNYNRKDYLTRNSPTLLNANYNHLIMLDGKHLGLQEQATAVMTNPIEMGSNENELLKKVLSCNDYKKAFESFLKLTPEENKISLEHICSVLTMYYGKFSRYYSPFDLAMNNNNNVSASVKKGYNVFMSKAQCGTCHFAPQFNGVKPPYIGSEFEVLGVPEDTTYISLSDDLGRYQINPATETKNAFRTGTIRNSAKTMPYMHNGVFKTLEEVINFYDAGGGAGHGLQLANQTLSGDSLHLTVEEKKNLVEFMKSLTEDIVFEEKPLLLPTSKIKALNKRKVGGEY
jgi:cytochrome c peroxidase